MGEHDFFVLGRQNSVSPLPNYETLFAWIYSERRSLAFPQMGRCVCSLSPSNMDCSTTTIFRKLSVNMSLSFLFFQLRCVLFRVHAITHFCDKFPPSHSTMNME